jgi:hypothetical protein
LLLLAVLLSAGIARAVDAPQIHNPAVPSGGVRDLVLEEVWRVGGEEEDDIIFGVISSVRTDSEGFIYLLDEQLAEIMILDASGRFVRTVGGRGEGPGEVALPGGIALMPDGTVGMVQVFPGRIVKLTREGVPAGVFEPRGSEPVGSGHLALVNARASGSNLVVTGIRLSIDETATKQDRSYFLDLFAPDGRVLTHLVSKKVVWDFSRPFTLRELETDFVWQRVDVGPDGRVAVCAPRDRYEISVFDPDGNLRHVIDREYASWPRDKAIQARSEALLQGQLREFPPDTEMAVAAHEPDILDLRCPADGSTWALPSRQAYESPPGVFATWDVFDGAGNFVEQVAVRCDGDPRRDRMVFVNDDLVIRVVRFWDSVFTANDLPIAADAEEFAMAVVGYRVVR